MVISSSGEIAVGISLLTLPIAAEGIVMVRTLSRKGVDMIAVNLCDLLAGIHERKAALGIVDTEERTETMRNNGSRRTPAKRAMLVRIKRRALAADVDALKAHY